MYTVIISTCRLSCLVSWAVSLVAWCGVLACSLPSGVATSVSRSNEYYFRENTHTHSASVIV